MFGWRDLVEKLAGVKFSIVLSPQTLDLAVCMPLVLALPKSSVW